MKEMQETNTIKTKKMYLDIDQIKLLILQRKEEIKKEFKAEIIGIFGSYARGEEKEKSDIDFLVRFGEGATFLNLVGLGYYLEDLFGIPVDIVSERAIHPMMKENILKELISV
jgi:predicted nucleotidyltransferase